MNDDMIAALAVKAAWFDLYTNSQAEAFKLASELARAKQQIESLTKERELEAAHPAAEHPDAAKVAKTKLPRPHVE